MTGRFFEVGCLEEHSIFEKCPFGACSAIEVKRQQRTFFLRSLLGEDLAGSGFNPALALPAGFVSYPPAVRKPPT